MSTETTGVLSHSATAMSLSTNGALAVFGLVTLNDLAAVTGIVCGLATLAVNFYYKRREDKRRERESRNPQCR